MSHALREAAYKLDITPPGRKFVLVTLADAVNGKDADQLCWPSLDWLAGRCGMSRRMVGSHLDALEAAGLIKREGFRGRVRLYRMLFTCEPEFTSTCEPEFTGEESTCEPEFTSDVNQSSHQGGTRVHTNLKEPERTKKGVSDYGQFEDGSSYRTDLVTIKPGTPPYEAWERYYARTNSSKVYACQAEQPIREQQTWPPNR